MPTEESQNNNSQNSSSEKEQLSAAVKRQKEIPDKSKVNWGKATIDALSRAFGGKKDKDTA